MLRFKKIAAAIRAALFISLAVLNAQGGSSVSKTTPTPGEAVSTVKITHSNHRPATGISIEHNACQTSCFEDVAESVTYIDKTTFIKDFHEGPKFLVLTGPRRFSKSSNLDMLRYFYEAEVDERGKELDPKKSKKLKLLEDKNIFLKHETFFWRHFAQYPVLKFNFGTLRVTSYDGFLERFKIQSTETVLPKFNYLKHSTNENARNFYAKVTSPTYAWTESALRNFGNSLANALHRHHGKKPMLFVDECDWPIMSAIHNPEIGDTELGQVVRFISSFVSRIVKHYDAAEKALLTGCMRIGATYSAEANNLDQFTIFDKPKYYSAYGFLQRDIEVFRLNFSLTENNVQSLKRFYDGYNVFDLGQTSRFLQPKESIYNTISVVKYLASNKKLDTYWSKTGSINYLSPLLAYDKLGKVFETCLTDACEARIESRIDLEHLQMLKKAINLGTYQVSDSDIIIQYFYEAGYLTPVNISQSGSFFLKVPNSEVRETLERMLYLKNDFLQMKYNIPPEVNAEYVEAMKRVSSDKNTLKRVVAAIDKIFEHTMPRNEDSMRQMLFYPLIQYRAFESVRTEEYADLGRYNCFAIRVFDQTAFFFETKCRTQSCEYAHWQIANKTYTDLFDQIDGIRDRVIMGISLNKQNKTEICFKYVNYGEQACWFQDS